MQFPLCNKKPERAPKIFGHVFPLCWRCTGLIFGMLIGFLLLILIKPIGIVGVILIFPTCIDGILQYVFKIMSTNLRRFITGFIGGLSVLSGL